MHVVFYFLGAVFVLTIVTPPFGSVERDVVFLVTGAARPLEVRPSRAFVTVLGGVSVLGCALLSSAVVATPRSSSIFIACPYSTLSGSKSHHGVSVSLLFPQPAVKVP